MFCVECGKEPEDLFEGLCEDCFLKDVDVELPASVSIEVCTSCGAVREGHRWIERPDMNSIMLQRIQDSLQPTWKVDSYSFHASFTEEDPRNIRAELEVELGSRGLKKTVFKETKVIIKNGQCTTCSRIHGHYYEAIIQVRPSKKTMTEEQKRIVKEKIYREVKVKRGDERSIFITSEEERHGGLDFYMSDNGVSKKLSKEIAETFGGKITVSSKLAGRDDGQNIYKVTYSVRIPPYERGNFVEYHEKIYRIKEIRTSSGHLTLQELRTGDRVTLDKRDVGEIEVLGSQELIRDSIVVSETAEEIKVLDPDDYTTLTLLKPEGFSFEGDSVKIFKFMDRVILLPKEED